MLNACPILFFGRFSDANFLTFCVFYASVRFEESRRRTVSGICRSGFYCFPDQTLVESRVSKPGITPESRMFRRPQTRKISMRSAVHHIAGQEQNYPVQKFSGRVFVERPNHNPFAGIPHNLVTSPEDLTDLAGFYIGTNDDLLGWQYQFVDVVRAANVFDPFGQLAWEMLIPTKQTVTAHKIREDIRGLEIGAQYTHSWHVAPGADLDWIEIGIESSSHSPAPEIYVDIRNRVVGTVSSTVDDSGIIALPNGWSRVWMQYTQTGVDVNHRPQIRPALVDGSTVFDIGKNTSMYLAKPQFEKGSLTDWRKD